MHLKDNYKTKHEYIYFISSENIHMYILYEQRIKPTEGLKNKHLIAYYTTDTLTNDHNITYILLKGSTQSYIMTWNELHCQHNGSCSFQLSVYTLVYIWIFLILSQLWYKSRYIMYSMTTNVLRNYLSTNFCLAHSLYAVHQNYIFYDIFY